MSGPFFTIKEDGSQGVKKTIMGWSALSSRSRNCNPSPFHEIHGMTFSRAQSAQRIQTIPFLPPAPKHPVRRFAKRESSDGIFARDVCDCRPQGRQSRNSPNVIREGDAAGTLFSWKDNKGNRTRKGVDSLRPQEFVHLPLTLFHFALHCS